MPKNITTTQQNQELIVKKTKNLMNLTKKILSQENNSILKKESRDSIQKDSIYIEPQMLRIDAGEFMMGSHAHKDEHPIHKVKIHKPFLMGKYQVTFAEYDKFCEDTDRKKPYDSGWGRENRPVINVSWNDANDYCKWLSRKTAKSYHLPSETQWEYACRAGTVTTYSFGDNSNQLPEYARYDQNSFEIGEDHKDYGTHPIGEKQPNPWGLYDMHGNVWEWCEDCYSTDYQTTPRDHTPYANRDIKKRVLRGGCWLSSPDEVRSAKREGNMSDYKVFIIGFRLARTLP